MCCVSRQSSQMTNEYTRERQHGQYLQCVFSLSRSRLVLFELVRQTAPHIVDHLCDTRVHLSGA